MAKPSITSFKSALNKRDFERASQMIDDQWQGKLDQELYDASESGNVEEIKSLITAGADVNAQVPYGVEGYEVDTPLANAAYHGQVESMATLVEHGADINQVSGPLGTPLHAAFHNDQNESAKWLLDNGANPFVKDHDGVTASDMAYEQYQTLRADGKEIPDHIQMIKTMDEGRKLEAPEQQNGITLKQEYSDLPEVAPPDVKQTAYTGVVTAQQQTLKTVDLPPQKTSYAADDNEPVKAPTSKSYSTINDDVLEQAAKPQQPVQEQSKSDFSNK